MTPTIKPNAGVSILWGTGNAINSSVANSVGGMILETLTLTPKNKDPIDIEGGAGFSAILVGLKDGFNASATAVYDQNKVLPAEGDTIAVVVPKSDGANVGTTNVNCTFWSWQFTRSRKKETMIELTFTHRPDINT